MKGYLTPSEITDYTIESGIAKTQRKFVEVLLMAVLAGIYIAMGTLAASIASHDIANKGLAKLIAGVVFPIGLMFVVVNGADLFTGNCLIFLSVLDKKVKASAFAKNLAIVLLGNSIGAIAIAWMEANSGMFQMNNDAFGAYTLKVAVAKTNLNFMQALILAIMCNLFVCAGVWMIYAAKDVAGKILASFFTIVAFVISGSEHIVANMYYIPAAIFAKSNAAFVELAQITPDQLASLTWKTFLINNAIPVVTGNIIGGMIIGGMYYVIYKKLNVQKPSVVSTSKKQAA